MAVRLFTTDSKALLREIKRQIKAGDIETWAYDAAGDFTHVTRGDQWADRAWLRPSHRSDRLLLNIMFQPDEKQKRVVFSIYQGRFIEMALRHVPKMFTVAAATPSLTDEDKALNQ